MAHKWNNGSSLGAGVRFRFLCWGCYRGRVADVQSRHRPPFPLLLIPRLSMKKIVLRLSCFGLLQLLPVSSPAAEHSAGRIPPLVVTEPVLKDSDDPAIWVNPADPAKSLVLGTCKDEQNGGLYVFDLKGKIVKTALGMKRPNNVDLVYGLMLGGRPVDIAVMTERNSCKLRVIAVPSMQALDGGGLPVFEFEHDKERLPTGVALYKRPRDGAVFAIVGARVGPKEGYLWQYRLEDDGTGRVRATKVREFGAYSDTKEIEAIAVDNELGHVYYSDERSASGNIPPIPMRPTRIASSPCLAPMASSSIARASPFIRPGRVAATSSFRTRTGMAKGRATASGFSGARASRASPTPIRS